MLHGVGVLGLVSKARTWRTGRAGAGTPAVSSFVEFTIPAASELYSCPIGLMKNGHNVNFGRTITLLQSRYDIMV